MLISFLNKDTVPLSDPKEGDLYKTVNISGKIFSLYYGYYEEIERQYHDPMPIYPNFIECPEYTADGVPIVTAMQDPCKHYSGKPDGDSCANCFHFQSGEELFGLCTCFENRKQEGGQEDEM